MRTIRVVPYDERWTTKFEEEANILRAIFDTELLEIHHIGSTAVPGLKSKPTVDIMPVVRDIQKVDQLNAAMAAHGYEPRGELGIAGRRYFPKGGDNRTHHVHVYEQGNRQVERHLAFRDYLRSHLDETERYGDLKEALAKQFPNAPGSYVDGKNDVVLEIEKRALEWYREPTL